MDPDVGYSFEAPYNPSFQDYSMPPIEEFSTEDNQLLMSVLNSTPLQEQYVNYYPNDVPRGWDPYQSYNGQDNQQDFRKGKQGMPMDGHGNEVLNRMQHNMGNGDRLMNKSYEKLYHPYGLNVHTQNSQGLPLNTGNKSMLDERMQNQPPFHFSPKPVITPPKQQTFHSLGINGEREQTPQNQYTSGFKVHPVDIKGL